MAAKGNETYNLSFLE